MALTEKIGNVTLNLDYYSGKDLYCDGEVEDELLDIVKTYKKDDYDRIIEERKNWAVMYHLSENRKNIISWYPVEKEMDVLEIGSGCGAVTGALADMAGKVTCVELSKKRSTINALRNSEYDNIEIIVGNFSDIKPNLKAQYDIVTLIGVLEYAESYIGTDRPYTEFMSSAASLLKKGGRLLIAIENKLGMKYWAGCKEDHLGRYYESIEDYAHTSGVKTFGKRELEEMFKECGFDGVKFYYPYPDYKFPDRIYSDEYLPTVGELVNNMRNFDNNRMITFDEDKAFDSVIKNGLFPQYSNSFFIELIK